MAKTHYLAPVESGTMPGQPRRAELHDTREHERLLAQGWASVELELSAAEYAVQEIGARIRSHKRVCDRMRQGLELDNGEKGAPKSDHDRLVWGRTLDRAGAIERHDQALLDRSAREVERYRLILAGKVTDFRLVSKRPSPMPKAAEKVTEGRGDGAGYLPQESPLAVDDVVALPYTSTNPADATPPVRWGEEEDLADPSQDPPVLTEPEEDVLAVLDELEVPTEWGRPRVREALAARVPEVKISFASLGRVILYRKLQPQD